jgi:hypothetical protein
MPDRLRLLRTLRCKVELNGNLKLTPASLFNLKRRSFDHAEAVWVGIVKLELHFLQPVRYILIIDTAYEDFPGMSMVSWSISGSVDRIERHRFSAIDEGTVNLNALRILVNFLWSFW